MKSKKIVRLSLFFSLLFLFLLTLIFGFIFIISLKPVKINLLNYFDRESRLIKNVEIKEIGDVYLSFNKVTKNFEVLIEDLVIKDSYFPSVLIGLDVTLKKKLFKTFIKFFDSELEFKIPKHFTFSKDSPHKDNPPVGIDLNSYFNFLKKFENIQIVNSSLSLKLNDQITEKYLVDLNFKESELIFSISEQQNVNNFLSIDYFGNADKYDVSVESQNFNFYFFEYFKKFDYFKIQKLLLSGSSKLSLSKNFTFNELFFNFKLNGEIGYSSFEGDKTISFSDSQIIGEKNENYLDISLDYLFLESKIKSLLRLNLMEKKQSKVVFELDAIKVSELIDIWPKNLKPSVYSWMKENSNGNISDFFLSFNIFDQDNNFILKKLQGNFDFDDTIIRYMESMPIVNDIEGNAKIYDDRIVFSIFSGVSQSLNIDGGNVELFDLNTDIERAKVELQINAPNYDIVRYLNTSPINKKSYKKLKNINGNTFVDLELKFPLLLDLPAEDIRYKSNVEIKNAKFSEIFNNYDLENFKLNIKIDNSSVTYTGEGDIFQSTAIFSGKQINKANKIIDNISGSYLINSTVVESLLPNNDLNFLGKIKVDFGINEDESGIMKIDGIGELSEMKIDSNFLGPNLDFSQGKLRFLIRPYDESYSGFFDIKAKNFDFEVNSIFKEDKITEIDVLRFKSPNQDFKFKYKNYDKRNFNFYGNKISLNKINFFEKSKFDFNDFKFSIDVNKLEIAGVKFSNSLVEVKKENGNFSKMSINLVGKEDFHKILIEDQQNKKFIMESNYLPSLLKILDIDLNIKRGSLKIEGEKLENSFEYKGVIVGNDIVFFDAPFLANFFSIFSLEGLTQKLKDGGIIFKDFDANYKLSNKKLTLVDSLLKGSELGIQFDSVIGMQDDYFMMNGSIIPAYTINTLLTKFPIVGDIITAGSPEDGLIGANFRVEKIEGKYEVFYNPISVFVPNIIKNFLID